MRRLLTMTVAAALGCGSTAYNPTIPGATEDESSPGTTDESGTPVSTTGTATAPAGEVFTVSLSAPDSTVFNLSDIASDAANLYVIGMLPVSPFAKYSVLRVPRDGTASAQIVDASTLPEIPGVPTRLRGLGAGSTSVYAANGGIIYSAPKSGGDVNVFYDSATQTTFSKIVASAPMVCWVHESVTSSIECKGAAGAVTTVFTASDSTNIGALAMDGTNIFWAQGSSILTTLVSGGAGKQVVSGSAAITALAIDASSIYWSDIACAIHRAPRDGGSSTTLARADCSRSAVAPAGLTVDSQYVWWTTNAGAIYRVATKANP